MFASLFTHVFVKERKTNKQTHTNKQQKTTPQPKKLKKPQTKQNL